MKKTIKTLLILTGTSMAFSANVFANDTSYSSNQELSSIRTDINKTMLENKLKDVTIEKLEKEKEIKELQRAISEASITTTKVKEDDKKVDYTFKFNEYATDEDILVNENNWQQPVGFIYKEDEQEEATSKENNIDFEKMLQDFNVKEQEEKAEEVKNSINEANDFKLINVELSKLDIYDNLKKASLKVNYITDNGYEKTRGSRTVNVNEGDLFNVKNQIDFEVLEITSLGVKYKILSTGDEGFASR